MVARTDGYKGALSVSFPVLSHCSAYLSFDYTFHS
nr:MAG TPA: hypothetical protein [Caudoviricetes sp.]